MAQSSPISTLKAGEYVQLKEGGPVWIRGQYDRSAGLYELQSFNDSNKFIYRTGAARVFHGFTF